MSERDRLPRGRRWSIRQQILFGNLLLAAVLLTVSATVLCFSLTQLRRSIEEQLDAAGAAVASTLDASLESAVRSFFHQVVERIEDQAAALAPRRGEQGVGVAMAMTAAVKPMLAQILAGQRLGPTGSLMAFDAEGIVHFHPDAALIGKKILQVEEYRELWPVFRQQMEKKQEQPTSIEWGASGATSPARMVTLVYCKAWDATLAMVWRPEEIVRQLDLSDLRRWMATVHYGQTGEAFLLDTQGKLVLHPLLGQQDAAEAFGARIRVLPAWSSPDRPQTVRIQWQEAPEAKATERLLYLHSLPRYKLTLGITTDAAAVYARYERMRTIALTALMVGAALAVGSAIALGGWITAPLENVLRRLPQPPPDPEGAHGTETAALAHLLEVVADSTQRLDRVNDQLAGEMQRRGSAEAFLQIYKRIFDSASEGMVITDSSARILAVNEAFTSITGYQPAEVIGRNPRILKSGQQDAGFYEQMWQALSGAGVWEGEIWNRKKDGTVYPEWLVINRIYNERLNIDHYFASFYEIGELKKREKQIAFMAYHDILTRLPNRFHLEQKLTKCLARIKSEGGKLAVLYVDLDNFKNINDVFGHKQGDDLLVQVSQRFAAVASGNDMLCRIGGDEFILLLEQVDNDSLVYLTANRILAALKKPFVVDFKTIYIDASIGISVYPGDGDTALDLIRSADMAMHQAKRDGKSRHVQFTKDMHEELYEKLRIENGIRYGLLHREFVVHYQPKVKTSTRTTSSLEALIRWEKGGKMISPGVFIPIAEESSLIDEICLFVLHETCAFHATMQERGVAVPVSVNISPRQFHNLDFVDIVEDLLGRYRMEPRYLEFEITETTAMHDVEHTLTIMHRLRELGIFFSIDDFGTGYSSLGSLSKMPVHTLKIDKQFVDDLEVNSGIVATIIAIGQQMQLNVVAEGVETEEQLLRLDAMGCHEVQGYYFSRPVSGESILQYLLAERETGAIGPAR